MEIGTGGGSAEYNSYLDERLNDDFHKVKAVSFQSIVLRVTC